MEARDLVIGGRLRAAMRPAWTRLEVESGVEELLERFQEILPAGRGARVVIKPNLNNDLPALTGNSTDLRVLRALVGALRRRGLEDIAIADGSNVGIHRRGVSAFSRLRVDRLCEWLGVERVDLNQDRGRLVKLHGGGMARVADTVMSCDLLVSVPKVKTHAEMLLSSALKNWVGIVVGQDKRLVHRDLARNILALHGMVRPHLVLVDGLVGMEGNGPGDGDPVRLGFLMAASDPFVSDLIVARLTGFDWRQVPYLALAAAADPHLASLADELAGQLSPVARIRPPPVRSAFARAADLRALQRVKQAARPITDRKGVAEVAYRLGVIQDVYGRADDTLMIAGRDAGRCGTCRKCEGFCPTGLPLELIGTHPESPPCIDCLYCWYVCPRDALTLEGDWGQVERQAARYRSAISAL